MTPVTHLLVNGCSFAFGDELEHPRKEAWPGQLADKLYLPIVNLAMPGSSGPSVLRRTLEYLYSNTGKNFKPLVILAWPTNSRTEYWHRPIKDYEIIAWYKSQNNAMNSAARAYVENFDEEDYYRKSLINKILMISHLENLGIPFIMGSNDDSDIKFYSEHPRAQAISEKFKGMIDYLKNHSKVWQGPLTDIANQYPKHEHGHPTKIGHEKITDFVLQFLLKNYPDLQVIRGEFLSLKKYYQIHQHPSRPEWC